MCQSVCDKKHLLKSIKEERSSEAPGNRQLQDVLDEDRDSERPERKTELQRPAREDRRKAQEKTPSVPKRARDGPALQPRSSRLDWSLHPAGAGGCPGEGHFCGCQRGRGAGHGAQHVGRRSWGRRRRRGDPQDGGTQDGRGALGVFAAAQRETRYPSPAGRPLRSAGLSCARGHTVAFLGGAHEAVTREGPAPAAGGGDGPCRRGARAPDRGPGMGAGRRLRGRTSSPGRSCASPADVRDRGHRDPSPRARSVSPFLLSEMVPNIRKPIPLNKAPTAP